MLPENLVFKNSNQPEKSKSCLPVYEVELPLADWDSLKTKFRLEYGHELPDAGEFGFGGPRGDVNQVIFDDQVFQGKVVKLNDKVKILFNEEIDSSQEWYFAEVFKESGYEIKKIEE